MQVEASAGQVVGGRGLEPQQQPAAANALPPAPSSLSRTAGCDQQAAEETDFDRHNDQDRFGESFQSAPKADKRGSDVHLGVSEHGEGGGEGLVLQQEAEGEASLSELARKRAPGDERQPRGSPRQPPLHPRTTSHPTIPVSIGLQINFKLYTLYHSHNM